MNDGRALAALALLGIAGAAVVRGSRGVVRAGRSPGPGTFTFEPVTPDVRDWGGFCQRCGVTAESYRMSRFNLEYLCDTCLEREQAHPAYRQAQEADQAAVMAKNYNFPGIGLPVDLRQEAEARRGSRGVVRKGTPPRGEYMKTERIPYAQPGTRWKTAVARYGFDPRNWRDNPLAFFTFHLEGKGWSGASLEPNKLPRRLRKLERWHLTDADGTKFHYIANSVYFAEMAAGRVTSNLNDPLGAFKNSVVWGAVPSADQGQPWELPVPELKRWLERRLPLLQDVFDTDLEEAGIKKPPPRGSPNGTHIPGPYARSGALASFAPGSFGIVRRSRSVSPPPPNDCFKGDIMLQTEHLQMLDRIQQGAEGACWNENGELKRSSDSAAQKSAHRDYAAVLGKRFLVGVIHTIDGDVECPGDGCLVKVMQTESGSVIRWSDAQHLDPYWDVTLVDPQDAVALGIDPERSLWIFGRTYAVSR